MNPKTFGTSDAQKIDALVKAINEAANTCDRWAEESLSGGWSTHQVAANRELANRLRRAAAQAA